jgi:hypothetical protein
MAVSSLCAASLPVRGRVAADTAPGGVLSAEGTMSSGKITKRVDRALHKKSGQKSDLQVNKDFLALFWLSFETRKSHFGQKKHRYGTFFVQSRLTA